MASNMVAEWQVAKKEFEKVTKEKRPKETFWKVFKVDSGIEPALKKCDEITNTKPTKDTSGKLKAAIKTLKEKVDKYVKLLDVEIGKEAGKTEMYKALKALKARAAKFDSFYAVSVIEHEKTAANDLLGLASAMADPLVLKSIANANAAIKRIASKPEPKVYNLEMENSKGEAGRKLATAIQASLNKGGNPKYDGQKYLNDLLPFSNPSGAHKMMVGINETKVKILSNIKEFAAIVKRLQNELA